MIGSNNPLQGTWEIKDFHSKVSSKIKSNYMKFGEEHLKFILKNCDDPYNKVSITIKADSLKSRTLCFKAIFELVNKDPQKNLTESKNVEIHQYGEPPTLEFPIYGLDFEENWSIDDKVTINYNISDSNDSTSSNNEIGIFEQNANEHILKDGNWEIPGFDLFAENVKSEKYQIQDLTFKLLINRPVNYLADSSKFFVEIDCVELKDKSTKYTFQIELMNERPENSKIKSVTYQFEKIGDSVDLVFDCLFSDITENNGFLFQGGASIKLKYANYDFTDTTSAYDDFYVDMNDITKENDKVALANSDYDNNNDKYALTSYNSNTYNNNYSYSNTSQTSYDTSKTNTGYVGLRNQGATCYMNSMLQSLFHIPAFRRIVYLMHTTGSEDVSKSIPLCLQRLFVYMQCSDKACSTKALTKSFGWDDYQTIVQHDVQEFSRVLLDNLEEKMKNTDLDGEIPKLFRGKYRSFVRCINVPFESSRIEEFYDLQLVVKDTTDLHSSFEKYVETEKLDGDNQYNTEEYGKQDAKKGIEFIEFPSILHLHLTRFEYDFNFDQMTKINSRFEFPQTIDLSEFLAEDADRTKSNVFDLYGVLVHSGTSSGGHYYAFLRTTTGPQWYQFNDSTVSTATPQQAIDDNFGGSSSTSTTTEPSTYTYGGSTGYSYYNNRYSYSYSYERSYSAYVLVYVRKSDAERIFTPVSDDEIPQHLKNYFKEHQDDEESTYSYNYSYGSSSSTELTVKVNSEEGIIVNQILRKAGFECKELIRTFKFEKATSSNKTIYEKVASAYGLKQEQIRLWTSYYQYSPYSVLEDKDSTLTTFSMLFLQKKPEDEEIELSQKIVVLMKFFDLTLPVPLQYLGSTLFEKTEPISALFPKVIQILGLPENLADNLLVFQEYSDYARSLEPSKTFQSEYSSVQSIIFQFEQKFDNDDDKREREALIKSSSFCFKTKEDLPQLLENSKTEEEDSKEKENQKQEETTDDKEKEKKEKEKEKEKEKKEENEIDKYTDLPLYTYVDICGIQKVKDVCQYFQSLKDPVTALAFDYSDTTKPLARVQFSPSLYLDELKVFIAKLFKLNYDPEKDLLLIYKKTFYDNEPNSDPMQSETLSNEFYTSYKQAHRIFYRLIPNMTKEKMNTMTTIDVSVSEDGCNLSLKKKILVEKDSTMESIKNKIFELINKNPNDYRQDQYMLSKIYDHKYDKEFTDLSQTLQTYETSFRLDFLSGDMLELLRKQNSKQEDSTETAKADDSNETAKADDSTETAKAEDSNETAKAEDSNETAKAEDSNEAAKAEDSNEAAKAEDSNETANSAAASADNGKLLVQGSHLTTEYSRAKSCDEPFLFVLDKNESYEDLFNRVKETLKLGDSMKRCKLLISGDNPIISHNTQFMKADKNVGQYIESLNLTTEPRFYVFHPPHSNPSRNEAIKITN